MKKICKILYKILLVFVLVFFVSCSAEITLKLQKDGSVKISYAGNFGSELSKIFFSQNVIEDDSLQNEKIQIDELSFSELLRNSGFSNAKIISNDLENFCAEMEDASQKSSLFVTGLFKIKNNSVQIDFSSENLKKFYNNAAEEIQMNLDLLLAPVFNDEKMTPEEYLEMISTFYGEKVSNELKNCTLKVNLIDTTGKKEKYNFYVPQLLSGD